MVLLAWHTLTEWSSLCGRIVVLLKQVKQVTYKHAPFQVQAPAGIPVVNCLRGILQAWLTSLLLLGCLSAHWLCPCPSQTM